MDESKVLTPLERIFNYQGREVRTIVQAGEVTFIAKDVCDILELGDVSKAVDRLDEDEKGTNSIRTLGGDQKMLYVTESGFYGLVLTSRKSEAKAFKRWVTHEVLPSIRKTGKYEIPPVADDITHIPFHNPYLTMTEEQKIKIFQEKFVDDIRNLVYSVQPEERHLRMLVNCFYAYGVINDVHIPFEDRDQFLAELLQIRLNAQEQETLCINYDRIEEHIRNSIDTSIKALVHRLR